MGRKKVGKLQRLLRYAETYQPIHDFVSARLPAAPERGDKERVIQEAADYFRKDRSDIYRFLKRWKKGAEARAALDRAVEPMFRSMSPFLAEHPFQSDATWKFLRQWELEYRENKTLEPTFRSISSSLAENSIPGDLAAAWRFARQWLSDEEIWDLGTGGSLRLAERIARDRKELAELRSRAAPTTEAAPLSVVRNPADEFTVE